MALHPDYHHEAGKGHAPRPMTDREQYERNFDLIFGKKNKEQKESKNEKEETN